MEVQRASTKTNDSKFLLHTSTQAVTSIAPLEVVTLLSMSSKPKQAIFSINLANPPLFFSKIILIQSLSPSMLVTWTSSCKYQQSQTNTS